ncbi:uncharacterized protein [Nothobranchius furzeri]|uniref:uncharacterized protein isoform X1 n=1 Tax=Nothobranchius furzeri TaxID=105023 RepID=UPI00390495A8
MCTGSVRLRFRLPASLRTSKMTRTSCLDSTANSVLRGTTAEGSRAGLLSGSERTGSACLGLNGGEPSQQRSGSCCHALSRTNPPIRCQPRHAGENVLVDSCVPGNLNLQVGSRGNYSCRRFSNQEGGFKRRTETPFCRMIVPVQDHLVISSPSLSSLLDHSTRLVLLRRSCSDFPLLPHSEISHPLLSVLPGFPSTHHST